ncbi:PepSY-associated TM helix domain-containing protein [Sinomicrobium weinanense]|uniref:PepSY domain-containing protein n=1 Tax=Sinomicrobium weinanense TaxID=2842200 RepID=A0A926JW08_9FLAO|nr:PepSY domain-containing protein [Sinomicrobium weinanense]MBC9798617.1 PepSY domain-containing protein [Sinomicrobium weinanense]MBU3124484.1 PepSY domain-containing protein [Sinomicrobium weinanense]
MKKNAKLNLWLWKWHFIAGIISLPFILVLAVSGGWYLFKDIIERPETDRARTVDVKGTPLSFQEQWDIAQKATTKQINSVVLPKTKNKATEFVSGRFSNTLESVYINPFTGDITNHRVVRNTFMYKVRKFHGELLMGSFGTKIVELAACWMVVLVLTGIYIWWPKQKWKSKRLFSIRTGHGKRILFRDLHAVTSFWISALLLLILAGGLPWTDVFGHNYKWLQEVTHTGYPETWNNSNYRSVKQGDPVPLDSVIQLTYGLQLPGKTTITLPENEKGVFTVKNETPALENQQIFHIDRYSGKIIGKDQWKNVGVMMRSRMWLMNFHEGKFGTWNFILVFLTAVLLTLASASALCSYLLRKKRGDWGIPPVPPQYKAGKGIIAFIILLGICLPLFGLSLIIIYGSYSIKQRFSWSVKNTGLIQKG